MMKPGLHITRLAAGAGHKHVDAAGVRHKAVAAAGERHKAVAAAGRAAAGGKFQWMTAVPQEPEY